MRFAAPSELPESIRDNFSSDALERWSEKDFRTVDRAVVPPDSDEDIDEWVESYLSDDDGEQGYNRAHQFTLNHVTYPFVRDEHFAAFPIVPPFGDGSNSTSDVGGQSQVQQLELMAGAMAVEPGDLIFFYKSDMQREETLKYDAYRDDLERNRGIVGIYRARSEAFIDWRTLQQGRIDRRGNTNEETTYHLHGSCSTCGTVFGWMAEYNKEGPDGTDAWCPGSALHTEISGDTVHHSKPESGEGHLTLAGRIDLEPIVTYRIPINDNTAYGTMDTTGMVWTGRFDNSMGSGKGSTIRHLLPEEAIRMSSLLERQAKQLDSIADGELKEVVEGELEYSERATPYPHTEVMPLVDYRGTPLTNTPLSKSDPITQIDNVGGSRAESLREKFDSTEEILSADRGELENVEGVGSSTSKNIKGFTFNHEPYWTETQLENHLFLHMTHSIREADSNLASTLAHLVGIDPEQFTNQLEYFSWEFPWGYANDQADFVCSLRDGERYRLFLFENKVGAVTDSNPIAELMLYVPWIARVMARFGPVSNLQVTPVLTARAFATEVIDPVPGQYGFTIDRPDGADVDVTVDRAHLFSYESTGDSLEIEGKPYASDLNFEQRAETASVVDWDSSFSLLAATDQETSYIADEWPHGDVFNTD